MNCIECDKIINQRYSLCNDCCYNLYVLGYDCKDYRYIFYTIIQNYCQKLIYSM